MDLVRIVSSCNQGNNWQEKEFSRAQEKAHRLFSERELVLSLKLGCHWRFKPRAYEELRGMDEIPSMVLCTVMLSPHLPTDISLLGVGGLVQSQLY